MLIKFPSTGALNTEIDKQILPLGFEIKIAEIGEYVRDGGESNYQ